MEVQEIKIMYQFLKENWKVLLNLSQFQRLLSMRIINHHYNHMFNCRRFISIAAGHVKHP